MPPLDRRDYVSLNLSKLRLQHISEGSICLKHTGRYLLPLKNEKLTKQIKTVPPVHIKTQQYKVSETQPCRKGPWATREQNWFREKCFAAKPTFHLQNRKEQKGRPPQLPGHFN